MTTETDPTVVIPVFHEKTDTKRLSKPLPQKPLSLITIDDSSRNHFLRLVNAWLVDLNIPVKPWSAVLFNIFITMCEKAMNNSIEQKNKTIWIQTLTNNSPTESKFLHNVFHGKQLTNEEFSIDFPIGGTIRIYGLNDEAISGKLMDLVQAIVYLTYSLYLESYVMRDSQVQLIISPPPPPPTTTTTTTNSFQKEKATTKLNLNFDQHPSITKRSSGLFNWLKKLNPNNTITRPPSPSIEGETKKRSNPLTIKRGLSLNNISKWYQQPPPPPQNDLDCIQPNDPHRFFKLKQKIQNAVISTSPECHFPYPALLNRLEVEEDDLILEQKKINSMHNEYDCPTPSTSRPAQQRRRSSLISSFSSLKRASITTTDIQLPQSITAYSSIRVPSLLADSKKGLEHLNLDTTSLSSFKHHQSITLGFTVYPIGCPDRPCLGPIMSKIDYFRYHAPQNTTTIFPNIDQTLGHMIRHWSQSSQSPCQAHMDGQVQFIPGLLVETPLPLSNSRPELVTETPKSSDSSLLTLTSSFYVPKRQCGKFHGCNQPLLDHIYSFSHGIGRVTVYSSMDQTCSPADKDKVKTWLSCSTCDKVTTAVVLNERTDQFSFAKYLELIFYSSKLSSPRPFCQHTKNSNKDIIIRCFHYNGITFKLVYEDAKYYELRVPRIQMAPTETIVPGTQFEAPRMSIATLKGWKHKSTTQDVDLFFESVRAHLDLLNHYTKAEARRKLRGLQQDAAATKKCQAESKSLDGEIKTLSKRLDTDHQFLLQTLADTNINELNDFRRHFAIQSESIIQYLTEWQSTKCGEVSDTIEWDSPDYIRMKSIHCFPGSSVLVREDEPTSIIAYTLSSNDYMQAILHDDMGTEFSDSGSIPSLSSTEGSTTEPVVQPVDKKQLPQQSPDIIDGYYSSIERKYVSPSTGASTETASFRTMVIEVVKSSVVEAQIHNVKRLEDLKVRLSPWTKKQQEEGDLKRQKLTERTLKPLVAIQELEHQETKEVKVASFFYENNTVKDPTKNNISPHIKHKFVHEGIEFTCIVYYAKEFETLRKQCDINQLIVQSLSRCQSWTASGGKSKSHFYKTQDDRLVIKEMMNAWNVAEKDAFLKFAPKYFEHMKRSSTEPSVLAKIFGFFTIRMKNTLDKKAPLLNLDVMVMEHLFYNQNIIKRFDFKGIQDRQVEEFRKQQKDTTLWDGDWINEYRTRLSVHEQSKAVLEFAISNDTEFLSKCNIMDYSLLVGIDQDKYEMTVGIVG
ncbi:hypothetical protein INT48_007360 [Thamnidium elegans]|uniref:PIPK domain-containing protein n=1 Tax=Thamnidium elegans TaxID=101142 RepID=A0A8H7VX16_9FUNG|nr:hypothetical protein INT48_007360 [Thamnidium elegans]